MNDFLLLLIVSLAATFSSSTHQSRIANRNYLLAWLTALLSINRHTVFCRIAQHDHRTVRPAKERRWASQFAVPQASAMSSQVYDLSGLVGRKERRRSRGSPK
jgi:hypothetical protein